MNNLMKRYMGRGLSPTGVLSTGASVPVEWG